jgi:hypothetical protein
MTKKFHKKSCCEHFSNQQQHKLTQKNQKIKEHGYVALHNLGAFPKKIHLLLC